ncbi:hypothetical protein [Bradyrhizobium sp. SZCCHNR1093]|uniref:hypothetical protein n=1 Tax=Bradyrhizobium sp. SZCCHNR1093 TaxID=3057368 RepID=UPI0028E2BF08|nr:hypothetical protein [Bradyrhizobium sp. SZCCHNR1093]
MQLTLKLDDAEWRKRIEQLRVSSVNTATAKALTFTAKDAQAALRAEVPGLFVLRRNWILTGIRIRPANGNKLTAVVGSIDKYMERHVVGAKADKQPDSKLSVRSRRDPSTGRLATGGILIKPYGSIGSAPIHTVVRRQLKRMDGQKKKTFQVKGKDGKVFVVRRKGSAKKPLQTLAVLQNEAKIAKVWDFRGTVSGVVQARFPQHFFRAILGASKR